MKMVWGGELFIQVVSGIASSLLPFASAGTVLYLLGKKKKKTSDSTGSSLYQ